MIWFPSSPSLSTFINSRPSKSFVRYQVKLVCERVMREHLVTILQTNRFTITEQLVPMTKARRRISTKPVDSWMKRRQTV